MQPVEARFRFRFESGPRENEWISLTDGVCSVGRLPSNTVQIADASVSGRHAELRVDAEGVTLVDLGSTNGTRVEGDKIESLPLGHGDKFQFGTIKASFTDGKAGGPSLEEPEAKPSARPASALAPSPAPPQDSSRVSADALERSGKGSKAGLLMLLLLLVVGAGFGAWTLLKKDSGAGGSGATAIEQVAGNLLEDYSFEGSGVWSDAESASQAFYVDRSFALSGRFGFGVLLGAEEWALAASEPIKLSAGKTVELRGFLSARTGAQARLGLELISGAAEEPSVIAWAPASSSLDYQESSLSFSVPFGIKSARVLVAAKGSAGETEVSFDDISVVQGTAASAAPAVYEEYELSVLGAGGSNAILSRSGRILFTSISTSAWGFDGLSGDASSSWTASATETGFELSLAGSAGPGARCELTATSAKPLSPDPKSPPYLASMGQGGYQSHAMGFKRENVSHFLVVGGANLARFSTAENSTISAANRGGQPVLGMDLMGSKSLKIQLGFDSERATAESLALRARGAAGDQRLGDAYRTWLELLADYPIDASLIEEAEGVCASLLSAGHERVQALGVSLEAADFFQLRDAYARCRTGAEALARDYRNTEIEVESQKIMGRIDAALAALASDSLLGEAERLKSVLSALDKTVESGLAARLERALAEHKQDDEDPRK
jgi:hypothetical protein